MAEYPKQEMVSARSIRTRLLSALTALRLSVNSLFTLEAPLAVAAGSVPLPGTGGSPHDMWYLSTYAWVVARNATLAISQTAHTGGRRHTTKAMADATPRETNVANLVFPSSHLMNE